MKILSCTLLFILFASSAYAQGDYLNVGQKGYQLSARYVDNKCDNNGLSGSLGISTSKAFDFSISGGRYKTTGGNNTKIWKVSPAVTIYMIKSKVNRKMLATSISFGFQYEKHTNSDEGWWNSDKTRRGFVGELRFFYNKPLSKNSVSQLAFFIRPEIGKFDRNNRFPGDDKRDDNKVAFGIEASRFFKTSETQAFFIRVSAALRTGGGEMKITAGLLNAK